MSILAKNKAFVIFIIIIGVLFLITIYFASINFKLEKELKTALIKKNEQCQSILEKEKAEIKKNLEEKYRADQVSYKALARRQEIEKKRIKELEEQIKKLGQK